MTITTAGRWIDLPASGGGSDRFALDEPGGAGLFQIAASNATLAARENGLRTLWEDFGSSDLHKSLRVSGDVTTFRWELEDSVGAWSRLAGTFRVRLYGETSQVPRLHLAVRALAPSGYATGLVIAVAPAGEPPSMRVGTWASVTTTSTTLADLAATLTLTPDMLTPESLSLQEGGGAPIEAGQHTLLSVWVGAWCTSNSGASKGAVYGPTVLLREP